MAMSITGSVDPMEAFGVVSGWLHDAGMSTVSGFVFLHLVDLYRFDLDVAASPLPFNKSNDSISMVLRVSRWLRDVGMSQVSCFNFLHYFVIDMLDLGFYRCDLDPIASMAGSNNPIQTFRWGFRWL